MTHHHDNGHDHHNHSHQNEHSLPLESKMDKLLLHWIQHNEDHASNYRVWANRAAEEKLTAIAQRLEEAARLTDRITQTLKEAARLL
jgi:hypothetical protein